MLNTTLLALIKSNIGAIISSEAFKSWDTPKQLNAITKTMKKVLGRRYQDDLSSAVLYLIKLPDTAPDQVAALRASIGLPDATAFGPDAPTTYPKLQARWGAKVAEALKACQHITHEMLLNAQAPEVREKIAADIRDAMGMGGLEDIGHPNCMGATQATMTLLVDTVVENMIAVRTTWFDDAGNLKPTVDDPTSVAADKMAQTLKVVADNSAKRRDKLDRKRAEELAKQTETLNAIYNVIRPEVQPLCDQLVSADFASLRSRLSSEAPFEDSLLQRVVDRLQPGVPLSAGGVKAQAVQLVEGIVMKAIEAAHPDWVKVSAASGKLILRRGVKSSTRQTGTRATNAAKSGLVRLMKKYGVELVKAQVEAAAQAAVAV